MKIKKKKEKIRKEKKKPPKVLVQVPSVYSVQVDPESSQTKKFAEKMIVERLIQEYPIRKNQVLRLEFRLGGCLPKFVEIFNKCRGDEYYGIYEQMFFSRSLRKVIEDKLLALSKYVGIFLRRDLGFEVPVQDIKIDSKKIRTHIKAKRLEKINDILKKYREKLLPETKKMPIINFNVEKGELYWINEKGKKFVCCLRLNSLNYKILYFLANEKKFIPTSEIANEYGKNNEIIRSIISKLRKSIKKNLKIDGKTIIEGGIPGKGYRVKNIKMEELSEDS